MTSIRTQKLFAHIRNLEIHYPQCIPDEGCKGIDNCYETDVELETYIDINKGSVAYSRMPSYCRSL